MFNSTFHIYGFLAIPLFLFTAFLIPIAGERKKSIPRALALFASFLAALLLAVTLPYLSGGKTLAYTLGGWAAPYGITIGLDSLSALFAALAILAVGLAALFSRESIGVGGTEYYALLSLFAAGLLGVIYTADLFNMFVFFEILSISSYALATYGNSAGAYRAAINYLVLSSFGTSLLLLGIAFVYGITGTLNMADIAAKIGATGMNTTSTIAYVMIAAGVLLKAAVVPLHAWKPAVLKFATPEIGALFASASATTALYAFFRVTYTVFGLAQSATLHSVILAAGIATMALGALMAFTQKNLMSLLGYSAISQVGYVLVAFGISNYAAGIFHAMNIVAIELALFLGAGFLVRNAKSSELSALASVGAKSPGLYWVMMIAFLSNAGVPLLNGFASKWMIYTSGAGRAPFVALVAIIVSAMTFAYSFKAFGTMFFAGKKTNELILPRVPMACLYILAGLMVFFGVFYVAGINIAESAARSMLWTGGLISAAFGG